MEAYRSKMERRVDEACSRKTAEDRLKVFALRNYVTLIGCERNCKMILGIFNITHVGT